MSRHNEKKKNIVPPADIILNMLNEKPGADLDLLDFYKGYIRRASIEPVSYTHLDVYKRQVDGSTQLIAEHRPAMVDILKRENQHVPFAVQRMDHGLCLKWVLHGKFLLPKEKAPG